VAGARNSTASGADGGFAGILMLDTRFPRPVGDVGNAASFDFPVRYRIVEAATARRAVFARGAGLLPDFIDAGRALCAEGARVIGTGCGFLALFQRELAAALPVPVATSSLLQVPYVGRTLPEGRQVGVLTADAAALSADHLRAAGADPDTPIEGIDPEGAFARTLFDDLDQLDERAAERDVVAAAARLLARHPDIGAFVFECTNLPPYAAAVSAATGRPVFDVTTLLGAVWHRRLPVARGTLPAGSASSD
jgi:hypothetical protein